MSAILAVYNRDRTPVNPQEIEAMLVACPDRAVDGQHTWHGNTIALGHQHLWVTPEEWGEQQPLQDPVGRYTITCDARLDNRPELFRTMGLDQQDAAQLSDASLILQAYQRWGKFCSQHLTGDFAFAIWDGHEQTLFVSRDALGARSVCYYLDAHRGLIGSEVSHILAHPAIQPKLNEGKVAEFLANLMDDQEQTFYESIFYLPPAHNLWVTGSQIRLWKYWDIDPDARVRCRHDQEYSEHYLELLTEAVRCRLRSKAPAGISLSGGLDSTALAALASILLPLADLPQSGLRSFSYVFNDLAECDERFYIQPVVERYQLEPVFLPCDAQWTLRDPEQWPVERGFVLSDPFAWLPQTVIRAAQSSGVRLLLAGYYGDVLFTGGDFWLADLVHDRRFDRLAQIILAHFGAINWRRDVLDSGLRELIPAGWKQAYRRRRPRPVETFHPGLEPDFQRRTGLQERVQAGQAKLNFTAPGQRARYHSLTLNAFAQGAAATRSTYNRYGLEIEQPYWDRRLVEFVMALPADQLGRPGRDRWLHRNAMAGLLPEEVSERRRATSFESLFAKGLDREQPYIQDLLANPQIVKRGIIRSDWLRKELRNGYNKETQSRGFIWLCISLELWLRRYW